MLDIINTIQCNMDQGKYTCGIIIDLKKAFVAVNHSILLSKPYSYGNRDVVHDWFKSYLTNHKQTTLVNYTIPDQELTLCGDPQGSVLGALLFLLYINDSSN